MVAVFWNKLRTLIASGPLNDSPDSKRSIAFDLAEGFFMFVAFFVTFWSIYGRSHIEIFFYKFPSRRRWINLFCDSIAHPNATIITKIFEQHLWNVVMSSRKIKSHLAISPCNDPSASLYPLNRRIVVLRFVFYALS